jgi:hypothetical protein
MKNEKISKFSLLVKDLYKVAVISTLTPYPPYFILIESWFKLFEEKFHILDGINEIIRDC